MINQTTQVQKDAGSENGPSDELLDYMLRVMDLETKVRYLNAVEQAARRYMGCVNNPNRNAKHKTFGSAKGELLSALGDFQQLQTAEWINGFKEKE